jgi:hypothetical protein
MGAVIFERSRGPCFVFLVAVCLALLVVSGHAATTQIWVIKYARDGVTILNETTFTYQQLESQFPVLGNGVTHYYMQGPTFNESDFYDPGEWQNVESRGFGAVKGTDVRRLCDRVGGMSAGEVLRVLGADNVHRDFSYQAVYGTNPRKGPMVLCWYNGAETPNGEIQGVGYPGTYPQYFKGMRMLFFADTSVNPWGRHVFGDWDMHETLPQSDWYNFTSIWPSSGGLSMFTVDRLFIYSDDLPVVAGFSAQPVSGTAPLSVRFTDTSSGAPTAWQWNFGDGNTTGSTTRNPVHLYTAAGTYTVTLRASNNNGGDTETRSGYIVVAQGVIPIQGYTNPPTDPDGDGLYEDLNANGRRDFNDVVVFFQKMEWIAVSEPLAAFNYNGNTRIDFNDIVLLFGEL